MIEKIIHTEYVDKERSFTYVFEPIEDTLLVAEIENGFEVKYLTHDEHYESPDYALILDVR